MTATADMDEPFVEDDRRTWIGLVMSLWLTGVFVGSLFGTIESRQSHAHDAIMLASLLWPAGYFLFGRNRFFPAGFSMASIGALILFVLFCALSSFVSRAPLESVQYTMLTVLTAFVVLQFNTNLDAAQYEIGLKWYAVFMAALVSGFAVYDYVPGHRLGGGKGTLNPASLALVTMSVFIATMAIRRAFVRIPILVAMGTVIYLTGARASAVAALLGLAVTLACRRRTTDASGYLVLVLCLVAGIAVSAYYVDVVIRGASDFFAVQDAHRGLESGGSGRLETWKAAWNLFLANPILGVGFRAHEVMLKVNTSAHNGYLALLAEIGVIGFGAALFLALSGLRKVQLRSQDSSQTFACSVLLGLGCGYFALAMFERYFINSGNPTSLLFMLSILGPAFSDDAMESEQFMSEDRDPGAEAQASEFADDDVFEARA